MKWEFHSSIPTDQFDVDKSLHNQARHNPINEERVEAYAEAMRRGDKFPSVIAHGRMGKLVQADGCCAGLANTDSSPLAVRPVAAPPCAALCAVGPPPVAPNQTGPWELSWWAAAGFLSGYAASTADSYRSDLRDLARFSRGRGCAPVELTRIDLDLYVHHLLEERRLAVSTVRRRLAAVHQYYEWAVEQHLLAANPAARIRRPRSHVPPPRVRLNAEEMVSLLRAGEQHSDRAALLVHLLLLYGCRIGEALGSDVDDVRGRPDARRLRVITKGRVVRELPLTPQSSQVINRVTADRQSGPLLRSATGRRWHRTNAARLLRALGQQALPEETAGRLHPHATRRAFVDAGLDAGATLSELQYALGHRSSTMVLHYAAEHEHRGRPVAWRVTAALTAQPSS